MSTTAFRRDVDRDILRLAVPALGALVAEPLFLLADTAMVGHLGATPLAGLGHRERRAADDHRAHGVPRLRDDAGGGAPARGRRRAGRRGGRGRRALARARPRRRARRRGVGGDAVAGRAVRRRRPTVSAEASVYLSISMAGLPAMLVVFAATGLLRGLQDTRTPLWVAGIGFAANIGAQRALHLRARLGHRRVGRRHGHRPVGHGRGVPRGHRRARAPGGREPVAAPRRACCTGRGRAGGCSCAR